MVASTSSLHDGGLVHQAVAGSVVVRRVDQGQGDSERVVVVLEAPYNDIARQNSNIYKFQFHHHIAPNGGRAEFFIHDWGFRFNSTLEKHQQ